MWERSDEPQHYGDSDWGPVQIAEWLLDRGDVELAARLLRVGHSLRATAEQYEELARYLELRGLAAVYDPAGEVHVMTPAVAAAIAQEECEAHVLSAEESSADPLNPGGVTPPDRKPPSRAPAASWASPRQRRVKS